MTAKIQVDRRVLGQSNSLQESGVNLSRLRHDRLAKVQREMAARDIGALLLTDIMNIRYTTGVSIMPLWTAVNLAHYVLVPVEGSPLIFEFSLAQFRVEEYWSQVRPAHYWEYLKGDIAAGPNRARGKTGALQGDLRRLYQLFGGD